MLVDHLLEVGDSGAVVPWYNVRKDLFLDKVRGGAARWGTGLGARGSFSSRDEDGG